MEPGIQSSIALHAFNKYTVNKGATTSNKTSLPKTDADRKNTETLIVNNGIILGNRVRNYEFCIHI